MHQWVGFILGIVKCQLLSYAKPNHHKCKFFYTRLDHIYNDGRMLLQVRVVDHHNNKLQIIQIYIHCKILDFHSIANSEFYHNYQHFALSLK